MPEARSFAFDPRPDVRRSLVYASGVTVSCPLSSWATCDEAGAPELLVSPEDAEEEHLEHDGSRRSRPPLALPQHFTVRCRDLLGAACEGWEPQDMKTRFHELA